MFSNMTTAHGTQDSLEVPRDIQNRSLPPLPISKRQLPTLPQSKSVKIRSNKCAESETILNNPNIIITPPPIKDWNSNNKSLRNLFSNMKDRFNNNRKDTLDIAPKLQISVQRKYEPASKWRPTLECIIDDEELVYNLITFMTKQYNEENILFLQCVNQSKKHINALIMFPLNNIVTEEKIDVEIASIYNQYITPNAEKQINLSSACFYNTMSVHQNFTELSLDKKVLIFEESWNEIHQLINRSILGGFYTSDEFQSVAHSRNIMDNIQEAECVPIVSMMALRLYEFDDYDSDDIEYGNQLQGENIRHKGMIFDYHSINQWTKDNTYMMSSKPLTANSGVHKWSAKIVKTTRKRQEFGIVSVCNKKVKVNQFGICDTAAFGARAVYGFNNMQPTFYYASYNRDNGVRCNKDLSSLPIHKDGELNVGDVISICVNMSKYSVKFYLNGMQVRKTISINPDTTYYPIILYSSECKYKIMP